MGSAGFWQIEDVPEVDNTLAVFPFGEVMTSPTLVESFTQTFPFDPEMASPIARVTPPGIKKNHAFALNDIAMKNANVKIEFILLFVMANGVYIVS
jgi:hypothetical protein